MRRNGGLWSRVRWPVHPRIRVWCHAVRGTMAQVESSLGECSYAVSVYGSPIMSPDQFNGYGYGDGRVASREPTLARVLTCVRAAGGGGGSVGSVSRQHAGTRADKRRPLWVL